MAVFAVCPQCGMPVAVHMDWPVQTCLWCDTMLRLTAGLRFIREPVEEVR